MDKAGCITSRQGIANVFSNYIYLHSLGISELRHMWCSLMRAVHSHYLSILICLILSKSNWFCWLVLFCLWMTFCDFKEYFLIESFLLETANFLCVEDRFKLGIVKSRDGIVLIFFSITWLINAKYDWLNESCWKRSCISLSDCDLFDGRIYRSNLTHPYKFLEYLLMIDDFQSFVPQILI